MTTYHFSETIVWANLGPFVRVASGLRSITVTNPTTGLAATVVQGGVTQAGFLIADSSGRVTFTTTDIPAVVLDFGAGPLTVVSSEAVTAGATSAAAAAASASAAAASAAAASSASGSKADKATLSINLADYGAVGNGTADDTAAFGNALNAVPAGGELVILGGKNYKVTSTLTVSTAMRIRGIGRPQITSTINGAALFSITASDVTLEGVRLTGRGATVFTNLERAVLAVGTLAAPLSRVNVVGCRIDGFQDSGIWYEFVKDFQITGNAISACSYAGVMALSATDGRISGNRIDSIINLSSSNCYGIAVSRYTTLGLSGFPRPARIVVDSNVVSNVPWEGLDTHGGDSITFSNNVVTACLNGIAMVGSKDTDGTDDRFEPQNCVCIGNRVDGSTGTGAIRAYGSALETGSYTIVGNHLSNNTNDWNVPAQTTVNSSGNTPALYKTATATLTGSTTNPALGTGGSIVCTYEPGPHIPFRIVITFGTGATFGTGTYSITGLPFGKGPGVRELYLGEIVHGGQLYWFLARLNNTANVMNLYTTANPVAGMSGTAPIALAAGDIISITGVLVDA